VNGNQPSIKLERFRKLLLNSVDEGLDVLGASAKHAIYYTLEKKYGVSREDIALKPEKFSLALRSIFGSLGAQFLEKHILHNLYKEIGIEHAINEELSFKQHIESVLEAYLRKI